MGFLGDLLSLPVKIVNAPIKAIEETLDTETGISEVLENLSDKLEEVDE